MTFKGDFFAEKREWSKIKDKILTEYLTPYLAKIMYSGRPTRIVDCFAGKGKFDDGEPGSPLIIARHIAGQHSKNQHADLCGFFIESKYAHDLQINLAPFKNCNIIPDDFERFIKDFLNKPNDNKRNYFFYLDPYGIKCLDFAYFQQLKAIGFKSLEILLNLNTTGFLREGCRMLRNTRDVPDWAKDLDYELDNKNTPDRMDKIAGGSYWRDILKRYEKGTIDFGQAEELFTCEYASNLRTVLPLVVNVPIKDRSYQLPKYRLIFATTHHDGLFLMTDTMNKAWHAILELESGGQLLLFDEEQKIGSRDTAIEGKIWNEIDNGIELSTLYVRLIERYGIAHSIKEYHTAVKKNEGTMFQVERNPGTTPKGQKARHLDYDKAHIVLRRLK